MLTLLPRLAIPQDKAESAKKVVGEQVDKAKQELA